MFYTAQISLEDKFQQFIPFDQYVAGERNATLVDLGLISKVPINMIVAENDEICSKENAERVFEELGPT